MSNFTRQRIPNRRSGISKCKYWYLVVADWFNEVVIVVVSSNIKCLEPSSDRYLWFGDLYGSDNAVDS